MKHYKSPIQKHRRSLRSGFSCVETIVSVHVLSVAFVGSTLLTVRVANDTAFANRVNQASTFVQSKMDEVLAMDPLDLMPGAEHDGQYEMSWTVEDATYGKKVSMTIAWEDVLGKTRRFTVPAIVAEDDVVVSLPSFASPGSVSDPGNAGSGTDAGGDTGGGSSGPGNGNGNGKGKSK